MFYAYHREKLSNIAWHGSLLQDKRDHSGTAYRRNRYYDPGTGQFTQEDPIGLAGGLNLYGFAAGDPATYGDPYGLFAIAGGEEEGDEDAGPEQTGPRRGASVRIGTVRTFEGGRRRGLDWHEGRRHPPSHGQPGHTLRVHVNVSRSDIRARAQATGRDASRFFNRQTAERAVDHALSENAVSVQYWLTHSTSPSRAVDARIPQAIGEIARPNGSVSVGSGVRVVLRRGPNQTYYIEAAYVTR